MKPLRSFLLVVLMMPVFMLHAQEDYLAQARKFLDAGKCKGAQTYYDLALKHQLNNRRDYDIERRIEECQGTETMMERSAPKSTVASSLPQRGKEGGDHDYVDLGLPSGTLWATCNVGADKPEDYGGYYAWAETTTKSSYNWDNYKYANGNYDKLTKYCAQWGDNGFTDNLSILQAGDDPAAVCWGAGWCTPTKAQWEELKQNTTSQWTTRNGVEGFLFTSKKNGQSLFLPAAGNRSGDELYGTGSLGRYWSRSLDTGFNSWALFFGSNNCDMSTYYRYYGFSVRPVRERAEAYKEDEAYSRCATIAACDKYLKDYPQGRYVTEVQKKKAELEATALAEAEKNAPKNGSAGGHEYVDLGLPSGTLWATCNIGAENSEGYGNYYAWGETTTKRTYNWHTYKYANGDVFKLTKYCSRSYYGNNGFTDSLTTLQSSDDPAAANWGTGWRTPTEAQWNELLNNTTSQWTTQNGVRGRLFTSKKNGQSLFLPAAGNRWGGELSSTGSNGYYWSRSLGTDYPDGAWGLYFSSVDCGMYGSDRYYGFSVRPVREK